MPDVSPYQRKCATPTCYNDAWLSRKIFLCGPCAEDVMTALDDKIQERVTRKVKQAYFDLRRTVRQQEDTINFLRSELASNSAARSTPEDGTVYYVQVGAHIKIGWTANLESRMRKYPPNSTLLALHPGTRKDENRMHRRFAADRTHGREWYVPSVSLTHHIAQVIREHGQPATVTFGAKPVEIPRPHSTQSSTPTPPARKFAI